MERRALLGRLADEILAIEASHPIRVAIAGITNAGKTTLAEELAAALAGANSRRVYRCAHDDFHPKGYKWRSIREEWTAELYWREAYDDEAFRRFVLEPLAPSGGHRCRFASFSSYLDDDLPEVWTDVEADAIVLVDGALLLRPELRDAWDYAIWLEIDPELAVRRALVRDAAWAEPSSIERRYRAYHLPVHERYLATQPQLAANVRIDNTDPLSPEPCWA